MKTLPKIECSSDQLNTLWEIYQGEDSHELRQRSHAVILRHKGFLGEDISTILGKDTWKIMVIIKGFYYFGFDGLNNFDYDDLYKKIQELEESTIIPKKLGLWTLIEPFFRVVFRLLFVAFLLFLGYLFLEILKTLGKISPVLFLSFLPLCLLLCLYYWVPSDGSPESHSNPDNINNLNLNGDNNVVVMVNNNISVSESKSQSKTHSVNGLKEFRDSLDRFSNSDQKFVTNNKRIQYLYNFLIKYKGNKLFRRAILVIGTAIIYSSIYYTSTIKSGILIISLLYLQFAVIPVIENEDVSIQKNSARETVSISSDTITSMKNSQYQEEEVDFSKIRVSDEHDFLVDVNDEKAVSLLQIDTTAIRYQNYFVTEHDRRAYLQVASYRKLIHALIQRENLIKNHSFDEGDCKILSSTIWGKDYYGVTIGDAARDNIMPLSEIQKEWNLRAKTSNVRAFLKTN